MLLTVYLKGWICNDTSADTRRLEVREVLIAALLTWQMPSKTPSQELACLDCKKGKGLPSPPRRGLLSPPHTFNASWYKKSNGDEVLLYNGWRQDRFKPYGLIKSEVHKFTSPDVLKGLQNTELLTRKKQLEYKG